MTYIVASFYFLFLSSSLFYCISNSVDKISIISMFNIIFFCQGLRPCTLLSEGPSGAPSPVTQQASVLASLDRRSFSDPSLLFCSTLQSPLSSKQPPQLSCRRPFKNEHVSTQSARFAHHGPASVYPKTRNPEGVSSVRSQRLSSCSSASSLFYLSIYLSIIEYLL